MATAKYVVNKEVISDSSAQLSIRVQFLRESNVYEGHFPDFTITPGVVLIDFVMKCLAERYPGVSLARIPRIKFISPIIPDRWVELQLKGQDGGRRWQFAFMLQSKCCSRGVLDLAEVQA